MRQESYASFVAKVSIIASVELSLTGLWLMQLGADPVVGVPFLS